MTKYTYQLDQCRSVHDKEHLPGRPVQVSARQSKPTSAGQCMPVQVSAGQCRSVQVSEGKCRPMQVSAGQCRSVQDKVHLPGWSVQVSAWQSSPTRLISAGQCMTSTPFRQASAGHCMPVQVSAGQYRIVQVKPQIWILFLTAQVHFRGFLRIQLSYHTF